MIKSMIALATATMLLVSSAAPSFANGGWRGGWHHHGGWGSDPRLVSDSGLAYWGPR